MLVLDRFEGEYALIEMNKRIFHIPKSFIPKGAKEGDVIQIQITVDKDATAKLKESTANKFSPLLKKNEAVKKG